MAIEDKAKLNSMLGLGEAAAAQQPTEPQEQPVEPETDDYVEEAGESLQEALEGDEGGEETEEGEEISALGEADLDKTVTLKDGREISVAEAVAGYMRNDHHTQSLQAQAETRQQYTKAMKMLAAIEQAGRAILEPDLKAFDGMNLEAMAYQNPEQYRQIKPAFDAVMKRKAQYDHTINQIGEALMADVQAAEKSAWDAVNQDLGYSIAGFNDERFNALQDYVKKAGFKDTEVSLMADSRLWRIIDKAKQFDDLKSGKLADKKAPGRPSGQKAKGRATKNSESRRQTQLRKAARAGDRDANRQLLRGLVKI